MNESGVRVCLQAKLLAYRVDSIAFYTQPLIQKNIPI